MLLHLAREDLKRPVGVVVRGEIAAKGEVLLDLRGTEPKNLSQVGNHGPRISPRRCEGNRPHVTGVIEAREL